MIVAMAKNYFIKTAVSCEIRMIHRKVEEKPRTNGIPLLYCIGATVTPTGLQYLPVHFAWAAPQMPPRIDTSQLGDPEMFWRHTQRLRS